MMDKKAQKVTGRHTEGAFSRIHLEMMSAHTKEGLPKIIKMCSAALGFYYYIIDIYFNGRANQIVKDDVHGTLICGTSVFKAERHDYPFISDECPRATKGSFYGCQLRQ